MTSIMEDNFDLVPQDLTNDSYSDSIIFSDRNKYQDVKASNKNWVKISTGYINACWILDKEYIATQYPMFNTVDHFWTLVVESDRNLILNLSGNNNYLNPNANKFGIQIVLSKSNSTYDYNQVIIKGKTVHHINFKRWPDKGVPQMKDMMKLIRLINRIDNTRMLIHCLAGIGRTGTFILIHYILKNNYMGCPIFLLKKMRSERAGMIQGFDQFKFALEFIFEFLKNNNNEKKKLSLSCSNELTEKMICEKNFLSLSI